MTKRFFALVLLTIFACAPAWTQQIPRVQHVFVVLEENTDYADVCGPRNVSMPFLCSLKVQGSFSANYFARTHPSIGNYEDLAWGVISTNDDGCDPTTCGFAFTGDNVVREVLAAGETWKGYAESLPRACYFGGDTSKYSVRHTPIPYISDVQNNCLTRFVAFEDANLGFAHDLANNTLPNYAFITPNLCNDGHDCTLPGSLAPDQWLRTNVLQPLIDSGHLNQATGDTVILILFDESLGDNMHGGGAVYWFMMGRAVKQNYQSTGPTLSLSYYSHESSLRLMAELLGLNFGGLGGAATAPSMVEFFSPGAAPNPPSALKAQVIGTPPPNPPTGLSGTMAPIPPTISITAPEVSLSPASMSFGNQNVYTNSAVQTVTLTNTGTVALSITSIVASSQYAQTNTCGAPVAVGANCTISVTFTPMTTGAQSGMITIADNAMGSPQTISLTATSVTPFVLSGPVSVNGQSGTVIQNLYVTNPNGDCVTISNASNITIRASEIGPCKGNGIVITGSTSISVLDNYIHPEGQLAGCCDVTDGILTNSTSDLTVQGNVIAYGEANIEAARQTNIKIVGNFFLNPRGGATSRGQNIQVWNNNSGVTVQNNYTLASTDTTKYKYADDQEDSINFGSNTSGIIVQGNYITGGHRPAGCGMIADTGVVSGQFLSNMLLNTGQCGIGITSGQNVVVDSNRVLNTTPVSGGGNTAIYVWKVLLSGSCGPVQVSNNIASAITSSGAPNSYFDGGGCAPVTLTGNTFDSAATTLLSPPTLQVPPPPVPPGPANCVAPSPFSNNTTLMLCGK